MTGQERLELEQLKQRQRELLERASSLSRDIERLEQRLARPEPFVAPLLSASAVSVPKPAPAAAPIPPLPPPTAPCAPPGEAQLPLPPVIWPQPAAPLARVESGAVPPSPKLPPAAPSLAVKPVSPPPTESAALATPISEAPPIPRPVPVPVLAQVAAAVPAKVESKNASFEMRLGTYWFVRIGAVLVLTGLVFLGTLIQPRLGPGGKLALLYLASNALLGAGAWWQRKAANASLKNYAQVLFAGGLAAVYFTTYAAHHFPNLRVIGSATLDGALLLTWAGFMVWISDRKKSELLALFSVGLAYYSAAITRIGTFTLWSNLVLACAAVFFLVRNRWAALSTVSLAATYASYTWWRFIHGMGWQWASPDEGLWLGASFLIGYWAIFTAAVFLSKDEKFAGQPRAGFLTLNNAAFFTLFVLTMWQVRTGKFWLFSTTCGVVLLALAALARRFLADEKLTLNTYLTQGLLLVTIGIIAKFSGLNLALALGFESAALLMAGVLNRNLIFRIGSFITAALATGWALDALEKTERAGLYGGIGLGALMIFNAITARRADDRRAEGTVLPAPAYFTALALVTWAFTTWTYSDPANLGVALAIEALALTLAVCVLPLPEIAVLGQAFVLCAQAAWQFNVPDSSAQFTGLTLAVEGVALLWLSRWRKLPLLQLGAFAAAGFAVAWGIQGMERNATSGLLTGIALAGLMILTTFLSHQQGGESPDAFGRLHRTADGPRPQPVQQPSGAEMDRGTAATGDRSRSVGAVQTPSELPVIGLRPGPAYFSLLTIVLAAVTTWFNTSEANYPLALVAEAILLTISIYWLRIPELSLLGQTMALLGHFFWQVNLFNNGAPRWWNPLLMVGMTLGLGHWWQKQTCLKTDDRAAPAMQLVWSLALVGLLMTWLGKVCGDATWLGIASLLAVGVTAYAVATRAWMLAACAQLFLLPSLWLFYEQVGKAAEPRFVALAPIAALALLSLSTVMWFARKPDARPEIRTPLQTLALGYRWVALAMSLWWVMEYIPERQRIWTLGLIGLVLFALAGWRRSCEALLASAVFSGAALVLVAQAWMTRRLVYLPNLLAIFVWLGQERVARRLPDRFALGEVAHRAVILLGGVCLWAYVSRWVAQSASGFYLTASWSVLALALLAGGIVLRERMYRWLGLGVLAVSLGRVVIFDVWKLETIFRVLSFLALGIVLIVLGFIYNRYQEKIRQWL